jgi:DNA-binding transcriptional LysR family regulator
VELNNIDLNKIAVFCQVVESGNYQRAAEVLHVTPSALSQTITRLEQALGFALFDRRGRRLVPSLNGLKVHREFRERQSGFLRAVREIKGQQKQVTGTLKVGAYLEFAKSRLTGLIREFVQQNPGANLKMVFDSPSRLHALLRNGELDLCFSIFPSAEKKTIQSRPLCQEELVLIAPEGHLPENPSAEQVLDLPVIDYYYNHQPIARWLALHFQKRPKKIPVRVFAATAEMVVALVRAKCGVGIVPKYLLVHSPGDVAIVRPTAKKLTDYIWLLENTAFENSAAHALFRAKALAHFLD